MSAPSSRLAAPGVVQCLEKVDSQCLLRLDERHVTLAVARELHVFCKFDQASRRWTAAAGAPPSAPLERQSP